MVLTGKDLGVVRPPGGAKWIMPGRSAAFERRFSVLAPGAMPFRLILSELERHEAVQISVRSFGERDVISRVYRFLRHSRGQRRQRANVIRDVPRVVHQFGMRNQPLCETDSISFLSAKRKTHREAHCVTLADPARSPDRAALRRQDSECHLRQAPLGAFRCDDKVAAEGKNASDADRVSIDGGYYRLREIGQHTDGTGATASGKILQEISDGIFRVGARILKVGASAECATLVVAGQNDTTYFAIFFQFREALAKTSEEFRTPRVARLRPTQRQDREATLLFTNQWHCVSSVKPGFLIHQLSRYPK